MKSRHLAMIVLSSAAILAVGTAQAGDPAAGRLKSRACVVCHGADGVSQRFDAPHLSGQVEIYLAAQLRAYRDGKRGHEVMNIVAETLSDTDIDDLAAWYSSIRITVEAPE